HEQPIDTLHPTLAGYDVVAVSVDAASLIRLRTR
ncbi:glycerol-3-phosphatase, partial [Pseudomonas sp. HMWF031]